jgi:D-alanyl-D-alanine dipeptidase
MHPGFVDLKTFCPGVIVQMNYATTDNFTGEVVPGYRAQKALLAKEAAELLANVQKEALSSGLSLKIFDSYRPKKAVQFFIEWAEKRESNPELKQLYYPRYTRKEILDNGFIARQSSHSRGSAVDLTLVDLKTGNELDMGTIFDYFDEASHTDSPKVDYEQKKNRQVLKSMMESAGFSNFRQEWWHYSLRPGPYPDQYFDFDIV